MGGRVTESLQKRLRYRVYEDVGSIQGNSGHGQQLTNQAEGNDSLSHRMVIYPWGIPRLLHTHSWGWKKTRARRGLRRNSMRSWRQWDGVFTEGDDRGAKGQEGWPGTSRGGSSSGADGGQQSLMLEMRIRPSLPGWVGESLLTSLGLHKWSLLPVKVTELCLTPCDPMDCNLPGSSVHVILQAGTLEWVAIFFSKASSQPRDWTWVSHIVGRFFTIWATREAPIGKGSLCPQRFSCCYYYYC